MYAIRSLKDGRIYVGMTENVERRLDQHNSGKSRSTKAYRPWTLFYAEKLPDRLRAREREKYLKGGAGKEYLKKGIIEMKNFNGKNTCLPAGRGVS